MAFNIVIKPIAIFDNDEIISYYRKESGELANRYYQHFLAALKKIRETPLAYSYVKNPVRKHNINKFPYKIYYLVEEENIIVLGIAHEKRSIAFVRRRLNLFR